MDNTCFCQFLVRVQSKLYVLFMFCHMGSFCVHLGTFVFLCDCDISTALATLGTSRVSGAFDSVGAQNSTSVLGDFGVSGIFVFCA